MGFQRLSQYLLVSIVAGVAAAIAVMFLDPSAEPPTRALPPAAAPAPTLAAPAAAAPVASYADAVAQAAPSVVNIYTTKLTTTRTNPLFQDPLFRRFFGDAFGGARTRRENSLGSGVIIDGEGHILTAYHVIEGADEVEVGLPDGRSVSAKIVGSDPDTDLAVMRMEARDLPAIALGSTGRLRVGDVVLAIGNPFGVGKTVTQGIISATGRNRLGISNFENFIQTDAAINPGNSGGALVNADGELVGINTAIFSQSGGSHGIGFAIPADLAVGVMRQILRHGRVIRGWLGITGQDVTPALAEAFGLKQDSGVLVSGVIENGPAAGAGIRPGDVITRIDDNTPATSFDILNLIAVRAPGDRVRLRGWRGTTVLDATAVIEERPRHLP